MLLIVLSNNKEIEVKDGSTLFDIQIDPEQYTQMWECLTTESMKLVKLTTADGELIDQRENLVVDRESSIREKGDVHCHFYLREKTEVELLRERVAALESGQEVLDGAVSDLGEAVSGLAEEGGLA